MPIEIRELIIKTTIVDEKNDYQNDGAHHLEESFERNLVEKCVQQVMRKLDKKKDR